MWQIAGGNHDAWDARIGGSEGSKGVTAVLHRAQASAGSPGVVLVNDGNHLHART